MTSLKKLDQRDPVRAELSDTLVEKLYALGLIPQKKLLACSKLPASSLCRRRLPVVMVHLKLAETVREAAELVVAHEPCTLAEANTIMRESKKGKLPIVNAKHQLIALTSRTDLKKNRDFPQATKDAVYKKLGV